MKVKFRNEGFFDKHTLEEEILKMAMEFHEKILEFVKTGKPKDKEDTLISEHNKFVKFLENSSTGLRRNIYFQVRMELFDQFIGNPNESWLGTKSLVALKQVLEAYYRIGLKPKDFMKVREHYGHFLLAIGLAGWINLF